jgi:hypothetical protein
MTASTHSAGAAGCPLGSELSGAQEGQLLAAFSLLGRGPNATRCNISLFREATMRVLSGSGRQALSESPFGNSSLA